MLGSEMSGWTRCLLLLAVFSPGKAVECPRPSPSGNVVLTDDAILKNEFPEGSHVTVECANGYEKDQGSDILTCRDGTWSDLQLICKKRDCGPPPPSPHLKYDMSEGTLFGARIRPACDTGYFLQGSSTRQCLAMGWSGKMKCLVVKCEEPTVIRNGEITLPPHKTYPEFQDTIQYSCDPGYTLVGNGTIFCQGDGKYSSPPPECLDIITTVRYPETTETTQFSLGVGNSGISNSGISTITAPSDSSGVVYEAPSSTVAGTEIGDHRIVLTVFSIVLAAFLGIGLVCCVCYCFKRKGSYNTGEALKMKEELLQNKFQNLA
ncbi:hypothetical protein MHYP_G00329910 [Metynnis hypsauchen]